MKPEALALMVELLSQLPFVPWFGAKDTADSRKQLLLITCVKSFVVLNKIIIFFETK